MSSMLGPSVVGYSAPYLSVSAVDTDYGIAVKYLGTAAATVEVMVTTGDMKFRVATVLDPNIDSDGNDDGVIDVSETPANNMGKVVDLINDATDWSAMLIGCKRADVSAVALATANDGGGGTGYDVKLNVDSSTAVQYWGGRAFLRLTVTAYKTSTTAKAMGFLLSNKNLDWNHNASRRNILSSATFSATNAGTTEVNSIFVYEVDDLTGAERLIYSKALGSDPSAVLIDDDDFGELLLGVEPGNGLLVRLDADAATTSATLTAPTVSIFGGYQIIPGEAAVRARSYVADMK